MTSMKNMGEQVYVYFTIICHQLLKKGEDGAKLE